MRALIREEAYIRDVARLISGFLASGDATDLLYSLTPQRRLPVPGADLELAGAFAATAREFASADPDDRRILWALCVRLADISPEEAPAGTLHEFLVLCGVRGMGAIGSLSPACADLALTRLLAASADPRRGIRDAVVTGIRDLLPRQRDVVIPELDKWVEGGSWSAMRAAAAGIVGSDLSDESDIAAAALHIHRKILIRIYTARERDSGEFRELKETLGSTLAPVVAALPDMGFEYLRQIATLDDPDIRWIVGESLREGSLSERYPETARHIRAQLP